jgi:hypothetical protein
VAMTKGPATVGAEFRCRFAATLLMLFQLVRTSETADVAYLNFLACFEVGVEGKAWTGNRLRIG